MLWFQYNAWDVSHDIIIVQWNVSYPNFSHPNTSVNGTASSSLYYVQFYVLVWFHVWNDVHTSQMQSIEGPSSRNGSVCKQMWSSSEYGAEVLM